MISAREIELETKVIALERQLVAMDGALNGEGLALARRYEVALREIVHSSAPGRKPDIAAWARALQDVARMALAAEKTTLPSKRCRSPDCVLLRGHASFHNDGLREWGKRPHQRRRPLREAIQ